MRRNTSTVLSALTIIPYLASAELSLPDLQPISGFSPRCTATYETKISACPDAKSFINLTSGCTRDCFVALNDASVALQRACQAAAANGDTIIAHAWHGDMSAFLCSGQLKGSDDGPRPVATNVITTATGVNPTPTPTKDDGNGQDGGNPPPTTAVTTTTSSSEESKTTMITSTTSSTSTDSEAETSSTTSQESTQEPAVTPTTTIAPSSTSSSSESQTPSATPRRGSSDSTPFDQDGSSSSARSNSASPSLNLNSFSLSFSISSFKYPNTLGTIPALAILWSLV